ncbi:hypothetical protein TeGR_g3775 [Tetraparma gracilis]|uniref:Class I SAM-dependent methyltransferase n=1 Tax=Tetraparma gracilis TaxID=2962635 RepID=A0ABQ6MW36_9STRA|nr:hypothetical protein TeGR_g3775 [Tetraparma gracilis]
MEVLNLPTSLLQPSNASPPTVCVEASIPDLPAPADFYRSCAPVAGSNSDSRYHSLAQSVTLPLLPPLSGPGFAVVTLSASLHLDPAAPPVSSTAPLAFPYYPPAYSGYSTWEEHGDAHGSSPHPYVSAVISSFSSALSHSPPLPPPLLSLPGMSGSSFRRFLNSLLRLLPASYLEVGVFTGSSFAAATHGTNVRRAVAVDDWSQFGGPRGEFEANVARFSAGSGVSLVEGDCWAASTHAALAELGPFAVYFFDGPHEVEDHYAAVASFLHVLADTFVLVVDDWNFGDVRGGTRLGIEHGGLEVLYERTVVTGRNVAVEETEWHNGVAIFVLQKR